MRVDLLNTGRRPLAARLLLAGVRRWLGFIPGPQLVMTYDMRLLGGAFRRQFLRASATTNPWPEGELELMGTLVSKLNDCEY